MESPHCEDPIIANFAVGGRTHQKNSTDSFITFLLVFLRDLFQIIKEKWQMILFSLHGIESKLDNFFSSSPIVRFHLLANTSYQSKGLPKGLILT